MSRDRDPPQGNGGDQRPDYAAMADTLERIARALSARAETEGSEPLLQQSRRLMELCEKIRADLARM